MQSTKAMDLIGYHWLQQVFAVATTRWLPCDQTLSLCVKGVVCETNQQCRACSGSSHVLKHLPNVPYTTHTVNPENYLYTNTSHVMANYN